MPPYCIDHPDPTRRIPLVGYRWASILTADNLIGIIDDFLFTDQFQYYPEQRYSPDTEQCAYSISWYANGELLSGAILDFASTSAALFAAQARYRTDGCEWLRMTTKHHCPNQVGADG